MGLESREGSTRTFPCSIVATLIGDSGAVPTYNSGTMSKAVVVLGTFHQLQGLTYHWTKPDLFYDQVLARIIQDFGIDYIFEEACGFTPTTASRMAGTVLGYRDVDPGNRPASGEDYLREGPSSVAREEFVAEHEDRERRWLGILRGQKFNRGLVICGSGHLLSFSSRLQSPEFTLLKAFEYAPHDKICTRVHQTA